MLFGGRGYAMARKDWELRQKIYSVNPPTKRAVFGQHVEKRWLLSINSDKNAAIWAIFISLIMLGVIRLPSGRPKRKRRDLEAEKQRFRKQLDEEEELMDSSKLVRLVIPPDLDKDVLEELFEE